MKIMNFLFLRYFDNDTVKTVAYTLTLWNGADLNFRDIKNPSVRLSIVGIVICQVFNSLFFKLKNQKIYQNSRTED